MNGCNRWAARWARRRTAPPAAVGRTRSGRPLAHTVVAATIVCLVVGLFLIVTDDETLDFHRVWPVPSWLEAITRNDKLAYSVHAGLGSALEWFRGSPSATGLQWFKAAAHAETDADLSRTVEGIARARYRDADGSRLTSLLCTAAVSGARSAQLAALTRAGQSCAGTAVLTSATATPGQLAPGATVHIVGTSVSASPLTALIDVEVYNPAGMRVFQQAYDDQVLAAGQEHSYPVSLPLAVDAARGTYTVKIGVFEPGWASMYAWNSAAARFSVRE